MNEAEKRQLSLERLLVRYSVALETGDFKVVAAILQQAETDPNLERMILEVNVNDNEMVVTPLEITDKSDAKLVKAPSEGKKVTRKEFQKMLEEQFGPGAGSGGPQIRIIRQ